MAAFQFEAVTGSDLTIDRNNLNIVRKFRAIDKPPVLPAGDYFDFIASMAIQWIRMFNPVYDTPYGRLYWNSIQIHENHYALNYDIAVTYGPFEHEAGAYQITVDQIGGTTHVTAGTRIAGYGPAANAVDNGGLIGVDGDEVHGVDIPVEETKITVMFRHPQGILSRSYIKDIGQLVGYPNSDTFLNYDPGEVLYLGGQFSETQTEATAQYSFAISYNRTNFVVGGITITDKKGWDIISPTYAAEEDNNHKVKKLAYVEIVRPAGREWKAYASTFGWGA